MATLPVLNHSAHVHVVPSVGGLCEIVWKLFDTPTYIVQHLALCVSFHCTYTQCSSLLHGIQPFFEELIHSQLVNISPHLMKTNGSLPFSQHSTTCPYPVLNQFSPRSHSIPLCSILILSTHLCLGLTRSLIMKFPYQNLVCVCLLSHTSHMPRPFHRP